MASEGTEEGASDALANSGKIGKAKPLKVLPTDRVSFEKQLAVLRGYAAASGSDKKPVSNSDVASIVGIHVGSVSNCNPFFADVGLLIREAGVYRPADVVFEYANSYDWDAEGAPLKLSTAIAATWFSQVLLPRLTFRSLSKDEAIKVLAEESKAPRDYRDHLALLIEYMGATGVISVDGNSITKRTQSTKQFDSTAQSRTSEPEPAANVTPAPVSLHPFVEGLLKTLPDPGADWAIGKRVKWLQAASNIFDLIYTCPDNDNGIAITINATGSGGPK